MDIDNKVVIVTGASSGIGLATARLLTAGGAKVALVARSADKLSQLSDEFVESFARPTDMTKPEDITAMVQDVLRHYGRIDVLINNAGQGYDASIEKTTIGTMQAIFQLDVVGPLIAMQQVIPTMRAQGSGVIINVSSGTALMHLPNMAAYSALKAALAHLSLTARAELRPDNIVVSVVYPYMTLTDFEIHTLTEPEGKQPEDHGQYQPPPDNAEFVAHTIVDCIRDGEAEVYAHDWMRPSG